MLTEARASLAAVLEAALPPAVSVYDYPPDQIAVPAVLVGWGSPWLDPVNICGEMNAFAELVAVAGRIDQAHQLARLEEIVAATIAAFIPDPDWEMPSVNAAPYALDIAGVTYLAASLSTSAVVEAA